MLALEPILAERLEGAGGALGVYGLPEFSDVLTAGKPTPCYYLVYDGYSPLGHSGDSKQAKVESRWLVIASAKHAGRAASGEKARESAQPLLQAALARLLGWKPNDKYSMLTLLPAPRMATAASKVFVPLAFATTHIVGGGA